MKMSEMIAAMQEKINRMLVNEVNRSDFMETAEKMDE